MTSAMTKGKRVRKIKAQRKAREVVEFKMEVQKNIKNK